MDCLLKMMDVCIKDDGFCIYNDGRFIKDMSSMARPADCKAVTIPFLMKNSSFLIHDSSFLVEVVQNSSH